MIMKRIYSMLWGEKMIEFEESRLKFRFGDTWQIFQLDSSDSKTMHRDYRDGIAKIQNTCAVDFVGIHDDILYFIEVKNFKNYEVENEEKLSSGQLAIKIAQKVRDSISCIVAVSRTSDNYGFWQPFNNLLCDRDKIVKVIAWLEGGFSASTPITRNTQLIATKLSWLTPNVLVMNQKDHKLPDVTVEILPIPLVSAFDRRE